MNMLNRLGGKLLMAVALLSSLAVSCISTSVFEGEGDCSVHFKIKFRYDMNMEYADAFHSHVGSVALYAFGQDGKLVYQKTEQGPALAVEGWTMDIELEPGTYDVLAWCGLQEGNHFKVPAATVGQTTIEDLKCRMERDSSSEVKDDLNDLYHGYFHGDFTARPGTHVQTINLIKNTNSVRVNLHHLSGNELNPNDFRFEIIDDNGYMNWDNTLLEDDMLTYRPWSITSGSVDSDVELPTKSDQKLNILSTDFTVGRMLTSKNPVLHIYNDHLDRRVLTIPLKDYFLAVRNANVADMDEQEFLDRNDDFNLTVLMDKNLDWVSVSINIHSWRVIKYNETLQ